VVALVVALEVLAVELLLLSPTQVVMEPEEELLLVEMARQPVHACLLVEALQAQAKLIHPTNALVH
jgi:hypothetical protein